MQVAAEVLPDFRDGAWVCELAPVADPGALWETLAACFGVSPAPGRRLDDVVVDYLVPKRLLLVLDNCEHLLDVAARAVDTLRQRCPEIAVLATSREGLALAGEQIVAVPSLGLPSGDDPTLVDTDSEAVELFVDRARDAKRDFVLSDHNAGAVALLCRRLDGIPLAIELAAARVRSLTPDQLVQRLDQRFKLLTRGSRASLERHQTLRNTVDWSYDLLNAVEQAALNRLSVFAGGADLRAVEAVVSGDDLDRFDVADVLGQLVDKSLVLVDDDERLRPAVSAARDDSSVCAGTARSFGRSCDGQASPRRVLRRGRRGSGTRASRRKAGQHRPGGRTRDRQLPGRARLVGRDRISREPRCGWWLRSR